MGPHCTALHCTQVSPVLMGRRQICILEFWQGERRTCPHRCKKRVRSLPLLADWLAGLSWLASAD